MSCIILFVCLRQALKQGLLQSLEAVILFVLLLIQSVAFPLLLAEYGVVVLVVALLAEKGDAAFFTLGVVMIGVPCYWRLLGTKGTHDDAFGSLSLLVAFEVMEKPTPRKPIKPATARIIKLAQLAGATR